MGYVEVWNLTGKICIGQCFIHGRWMMVWWRIWLIHTLLICVSDELAAEGVPCIGRGEGGGTLSAWPRSPSLPPRACLWGKEKYRKRFVSCLEGHTVSKCFATESKHILLDNYMEFLHTEYGLCCQHIRILVADHWWLYCTFNSGNIWCNLTCLFSIDKTVVWLCLLSLKCEDCYIYQINSLIIPWFKRNHGTVFH